MFEFPCAPRRPATRASLSAFVRSLAPLLLSAALLAQSSQPQFKIAVEYVEIEARVLDEHDQPVRGLARDEFQLLEDGVAQDVTAFAEIDIPPPPTPPPQAGSAALVEAVRPDVASNAPKEANGRVYAMVFDSDFISPSRIPEVRVGGHRNQPGGKYQGGRHKGLAPDARAANARTRPGARIALAVGPPRRGGGQGAYRSMTRIPLHVLPGNYVLTVEAQRPGSNNEPVRRAIPFRVH